MENFDEFFTRQNLNKLGYKNISKLSNLEFGEIKEYILENTENKSDSDRHVASLLAMTEKKLKNQVPVAYVTSQVRFPNLNLKITNDVLIPRVETEWLIEQAAKTLSASPFLPYQGDQQLQILEIGVGSGYVVLSLAKRFPKINFTGIDVSSKAVDLASENQKLNNISNVKLVCSAVEKFKTDTKFDLIISNPPYIPIRSKQVSNSVRKYEPEIALFSGIDGLEVSREIIKFVKDSLKVGGSLLLELNSKTQILKLKKEFGNDFKFEMFRDVFGKWRFVRLLRS